MTNTVDSAKVVGFECLSGCNVNTITEIGDAVGHAMDNNHFVIEKGPGNVMLIKPDGGLIDLKLADWQRRERSIRELAHPPVRVECR